MEMDNYDKMSEAASRRFLTLDQEDMLRRVPLEHTENCMYVTLLNDRYCVDRKTGYVYRLEKNTEMTETLPENAVRANMEETLSIFDMLDRSPHPPKANGNWVSMTQLASCSGAGPVSFDMFQSRLKPFEGHTEELARACRQCGGTERKGGDVSFEIPVFDQFPMWFQYWDADDEFSASISILWDETMPLHLHYETVWYIMGLFLDKLRGR